MNWVKCEKTWNCKLCSDYNYCKDDIENKRKNKKRKRSSKKVARRNDKYE